MKRLTYILILVALTIGATCCSARADTDQRCLATCMNGGGIAATCLRQCSYDETPQILKNSGNTATSTHDVFEAPKPLGNEVLLSQTTTTKPAGRSLDYVCLNQCLHDGSTYDRCSKSCVKTDCPIGAPGCNDLIGRTPIQPVKPTNPAPPPAGQ